MELTIKNLCNLIKVGGMCNLTSNNPQNTKIQIKEKELNELYIEECFILI